MEDDIACTLDQLPLGRAGSPWLVPTTSSGPWLETRFTCRASSGTRDPPSTGCRPRSAPRHEQRAADGVVCLQDQEEVLQGTQEEANGPDQEAEEEEEGGSRQREARCGQ